MKGNHLGSIWIRPDQDSTNDVDGSILSPSMFKLDEGRHDSLHLNNVGYPSRPIQLAKILHESSVLFKNLDGVHIWQTGTEVSCPMFSKNKSRKNFPFCYVVEVKRSPLVRSTKAKTIKSGHDGEGDVLSPLKMGKGLKNAKNKFSKNIASAKAEIHAPVAYSLVIHPPIVIENLLPERGRFELMNAVSKSVLWWGNLEPGERIPIHTVGLDAPLLLLVNLGFCRTPVGEGALIHHGGGDGFWKGEILICKKYY